MMKKRLWLARDGREDGADYGLFGGDQPEYHLSRWIGDLESAFCAPLFQHTTGIRLRPGTCREVGAIIIKLRPTEINSKRGGTAPQSRPAKEAQ